MAVINSTLEASRTSTSFYSLFCLSLRHALWARLRRLSYDEFNGHLRRFITRAVRPHLMGFCRDVILYRFIFCRRRPPMMIERLHFESERHAPGISLIGVENQAATAPFESCRFRRHATGLGKFMSI